MSQANEDFLELTRLLEEIKLEEEKEQRRLDERAQHTTGTSDSLIRITEYSNSKPNSLYFVEDPRGFLLLYPTQLELTEQFKEATMLDTIKSIRANAQMVLSGKAYVSASESLNKQHKKGGISEFRLGTNGLLTLISARLDGPKNQLTYYVFYNGKWIKTSKTTKDNPYTVSFCNNTICLVYNKGQDKKHHYIEILEFVAAKNDFVLIHNLNYYVPIEKIEYHDQAKLLCLQTAYDDLFTISFVNQQTTLIAKDVETFSSDDLCVCWIEKPKAETLQQVHIKAFEIAKNVLPGFVLDQTFTPFANQQKSPIKTLVIKWPYVAGATHDEFFSASMRAEFQEENRIYTGYQEGISCMWIRETVLLALSRDKVFCSQIATPGVTNLPFDMDLVPKRHQRSLGFIGDYIYSIENNKGICRLLLKMH